MDENLNFDEQQRVLKRMNRDRDLELTGWVAFVVGVILTSLLFLMVFIPMAEADSAAEAQSQCLAD